jgi:hypothetical protein
MLTVFPKKTQKISLVREILKRRFSSLKVSITKHLTVAISRANRGVGCMALLVTALCRDPVT